MAKRHEPHRTKNTKQFYSEVNPYIYRTFKELARKKGVSIREATEEALLNWIKAIWRKG